MTTRAKTIAHVKGRLRGHGAYVRWTGKKNKPRERELKALLKRARTPIAKPKGKLPNPTLPGATKKIREMTGDSALYVVRGLYGYSIRSVSYRRQTGTVYKTLSDLYKAIRNGERPQEKRNPALNEWDDETLNEAARLGSTQARALGKQERASRSGPRFFNVTWFSPTRQKRVGFIRPIEATSASDARRQAKAMITNEKAVNIVAKPARENPKRKRKPKFKVGSMVYSYQNRDYKAPVNYIQDRGVQDGVDYGFHYRLSLKGDDGYKSNSNWIAEDSLSRSKQNPGIMEIAGGLQALDYLGEKVGVSGKRKRNPLTVPEQHQLKIAKRTLKMPDAIAGVMGGPTKAEAREIIKRLESKTKRNPAGVIYQVVSATSKNDPVADIYYEGASAKEAAAAARAAHGDVRVYAIKGDNWREVAVYRDGKRRNNPSVNEMSERFQGRATGKTEEYYFSDSAPRLDMSRGGKLVFLKLKGATIRVPASVVAIDAKLEKLWLGCKSLTGMFKRKAKPGEQLDYGDVDAICYLTAKKHIGNSKPYEYVHNFGENGGRKPRLLIDAEGMPILKGGDYKIEDRGIVN